MALTKLKTAHLIVHGAWTAAAAYLGQSKNPCGRVLEEVRDGRGALVHKTVEAAEQWRSLHP